MLDLRSIFKIKFPEASPAEIVKARYEYHDQIEAIFKNPNDSSPDMRVCGIVGAVLTATNQRLDNLAQAGKQVISEKYGQEIPRLTRSIDSSYSYRLRVDVMRVDQEWRKDITGKDCYKTLANIALAEEIISHTHEDLMALYEGYDAWYGDFLKLRTALRPYGATLSLDRPHFILKYRDHVTGQMLEAQLTGDIASYAFALNQACDAIKFHDYIKTQPLYKELNNSPDTHSDNP